MVKCIKQKGLLFLIFISLIQLNALAQENEACKVLLPEISESYQGACKNGLAHGNGIAKGLDVYEGKFKKGLPHGEGKYTWSNGNFYDGSWKEGKRNGKGIMYNASEEQKILGMWKNDVFIKKIEERPYVILQKMGVTGFSFKEKMNTAPGSVEIVFARDGVESKMVQNLMIDASSGFVKTSDRYSGVDNITFPTEIKVEFTAPNRFQTTTINYGFKFRVVKESSWKVIIRY